VIFNTHYISPQKNFEFYFIKFKFPSLGKEIFNYEKNKEFKYSQVILLDNILLFCGEYKMKFTTISRKDYNIKQYIIYGCLLFILIILALYHFNKVILQQNEINPFIAFLSQFSLDFSIILIPVVLGLTNIRKNFRKKFNNLFSMKEKVLHLREEIVHHFVKFHIEIKRESFILSPLIINEIKSHLRDFQLSHYADIFDEIIINWSVYNLDQLLFEVIKLTKQYDDEQYIKYLKNNTEAQQILKKIQD